MTEIRSFVFMAAAATWTLMVCLVFLPVFLLPRKATQVAARVWTRGLMALLAAICGLRYRIRGMEHLPAGGVIIASKHQSAWETLIFHLLFDDPIFVMKRELFRVPLVGWYMKRSGAVGVDRSAGFRAIKAMIPRVDTMLGEGSKIIVFPEGTRTAPGSTRAYQPGIAALYMHCDAPVVPVALNSGLFWGRRSFHKYPGVITLQFLPTMPRGLDRKAFLRELKKTIDTASRELAKDPHVDDLY
jgi:1-acyl-sn-glycerol-3-phosphate acyltransferase